jgi:hypothetical protein
MHNNPGAKTIFLSQNGICWIFFIQFYCLGSHTEHHRWRCSYKVRVNISSFIRDIPFSKQLPSPRHFRLTLPQGNRVFSE